jgi:predicted transcriptional regulator
MPTMTLNLSEKEMAVLEQLAERKGMNKTAVMKQALRTYQLVDARLCEGGRIYFENDKKLKAELILT